MTVKDSPTKEAQEPRGWSHLRAGTLGAFAVAVMAMAFAAPSVSMFFNSPFAAANAGKAMPLVFLISGVAVLFVALCIASFARKIPTSGYAYSFVSHGMGPAMGFISGWSAVFVFIGTPLIVPPVFGMTLSDLVQRTIGINIHWAVFAIALLLFVMILGILGIQESLRTGAIFLGFEMTVLTLFGLYMLIHGGPEGHQLSTFSPASAPSFGGLAVGLVFGILSFGGFESAATLGEETREPRQLVPKAVIWAVILLTVFYTFASYAATVGWGPSHMAGYASNGTPFVALAQRYGGDWLARVFDAMVCAGLLADSIAAMNAGARVLFAMGRERMLPSQLSVVHATRKTPWVAIIVTTAVGGIVGVFFGVAWSPTQWWGFLGTILALVEIFVYILVSLAVGPFYFREHRDEFSPVFHVVVPLVATAIMLLPVVLPGGLVYPVPAYPFNLTPYIAIAWIVVGGALLLWLNRVDPQRVRRAGQVIANPDVVQLS